MSSITITIGERLRCRRQELGYSQEYTSELAGLHPTYIGQVERGEKNLTIESLAKICVALDLPMEDVVCKIIVAESKHKEAQKCYDLIANQPLKDQKKLCMLIEDIIKYKES